MCLLTRHETGHNSMNPQGKPDENTRPTPKVPYQRPELKRVGTLRDVTAQVAASTDF
jgi:hypothetical protein